MRRADDGQWLLCDIHIAGGGYAGIVLGERLAFQSGLHCLVVAQLLQFDSVPPNQHVKNLPFL